MGLIQPGTGILDVALLSKSDTLVKLQYPMALFGGVRIVTAPQDLLPKISVLAPE